MKWKRIVTLFFGIALSTGLSTTAQEKAAAPENLPGEGLAGHDFFYADVRRQKGPGGLVLRRPRGEG